MIRAATNPGAARRFGRRLKWRLIYVLFALGLGFGATFWYSTEIFRWMIAPSDGLLSPFDGGKPVFLGPTHMFGTTLKLASYGAVSSALPVAVVGGYTLISPIFTRYQRRLIKTLLPASALLFAGGIAFVYYVMLPVGLRFLLNFGKDVAIPLISITEYLQLLTQLMFWMGIVFQLPLVMWILVKVKAVRYRRLNWLRRVVPFAALILGVILTPGTDPLNALLVAVPIVVLYEVGLFLAWTARPEEGNYLWLRSLANAVRWVLRKVRTIVLAPVRGPWWLIRKILRR